MSPLWGWRSSWSNPTTISLLRSLLLQPHKFYELRHAQQARQLRFLSLSHRLGEGRGEEGPVHGVVSKSLPRAGQRACRLQPTGFHFLASSQDKQAHPVSRAFALKRKFPISRSIPLGIRIAVSGLTMARRQRKDGWWVGPIAQLAGLIALACALIPGVREMLISIGIIAFIVLGVIIVGLIGFAFYRLSNPRRRLQPAGVALSAIPSVIPNPPRATSATLHEQSSKPLVTDELIKQLRSMDWFQFEKLVGHVYRKLGYAVTRSGGANPDGGIDLIIEKAGQRTAVQCKHWKARDVGVKVVREFLGALTDAKIQTGILVTLCGYTADARQLAAKHRIEIVNEGSLTRMLESTDARFDAEVIELLCDTRKFCPKCDRELVIRTARKGKNVGSKFWGCSACPRCDFTLPID